MYLFLLSLQASDLQVFLRDHELEICLEEIQIVLIVTRLQELELWGKKHLCHYSTHGRVPGATRPAAQLSSTMAQAPRALQKNPPPCSRTSTGYQLSQNKPNEGVCCSFVSSQRSL